MPPYGRLQHFPRRGRLPRRGLFAALAKPLALDADGAGDEDEQPTRDPHTLAVGFLLRLRRTGWLEEQPGSYESEPTLAFMPEVTPLLDALEEILNPRVVTYTGKLYKAWQLLGSIGQEKAPTRTCCGRWRQTLKR